jgi:hypothetical protein
MGVCVGVEPPSRALVELPDDSELVADPPREPSPPPEPLEVDRAVVPSLDAPLGVSDDWAVPPEPDPVDGALGAVDGELDPADGELCVDGALCPADGEL